MGSRFVTLPKSRLRRLLLLYKPARRRSRAVRILFYLVTFVTLPVFALLAFGAWAGPDETLAGLPAVAVLAVVAFALRRRAIVVDGRLRPVGDYAARDRILEELSFTLKEPPRRRPLSGFCASLAGSVLLMAGFYGLGRIAYKGIRLRERGRRLRAVDGRSLLRRRPGEPPVLLLRSFDDEELQDPRPVSFSMRRYEESLCKALDGFGPVIAIGRPGDDLSFAGAGRLFVSDEDWRQAVRHFMNSAGAVVIQVGRTEGLWWEISEAFKLVSFDRLLFFFPYVHVPAKSDSGDTKSEFSQRWNLPRRRLERMIEEREARYQAFRARAADRIPGGLPPELGTAVFLDFTRDGQARLLGPRYSLAPFSANFILLVFRRRIGFNIARTVSPFKAKLYEIAG